MGKTVKKLLSAEKLMSNHMCSQWFITWNNITVSVTTRTDLYEYQMYWFVYIPVCKTKEEIHVTIIT